MRTIRVLHCQEIVGGNPQMVARAEREIGLDSWAVSFRSSPFGYKSDEVLWNNEDSLPIREVKRWRLLCRALRYFDIVSFNFGQSIMPHRFLTSPENRRGFRSVISDLYRLYSYTFELTDLPLLKRAGKGIIVTYHGDDARQGDFCLAHFDLHHVTEVESGFYSRESDAHKRYKIARFARYADCIFALTPDLLHMLPPQAEFLPVSNVDLRDWRPVERPQSDLEEPLVIHAPTHRRGKGTRFVLDAISRLKAEGVALRFALVEGVSQVQARRMYEHADLLIDQLLTGWYGCGAVEMMALGKPVICYIREGDLRFVPEQMRKDLPIINATPTTLYDVLKEWLTTRRYDLRNLGQVSRAYVEKWHDPLKIAARLEDSYKAIMAKQGRDWNSLQYH